MGGKGRFENHEVEDILERLYLARRLLEGDCAST